MCRFALAAAVLIALATQAKADSIASSLPIGAVFESSIKVSRTLVPLPPGHWIVTSLNESGNNNGDVIANVTLLNIVKDKMQGYITISTNVDTPRGGGWQSLNFCSRKDLYFLQVDSDYPNEQSCWGINHIIIDKTGAYRPKYGKNIWQALADRRLSMPRVMIDTVFRFANRPGYITYEILLNPEFYGFSAAEESNWSNSPWHKDLIARDPRRQQFLEQIREQYAAFAPTLRSQFP